MSDANLYTGLQGHDPAAEETLRVDNGDPASDDGTAPTETPPPAPPAKSK